MCSTIGPNYSTEQGNVGSAARLLDQEGNSGQDLPRQGEGRRGGQAHLVVREDAADEVGAPGGAAPEAVDGLAHGLERRRGVDLRPAAADRRGKVVQHLAGHRDPFSLAFSRVVCALLGFLGLGGEGGEMWVLV
jgi:hypothetical protein